MMMMMNKAKLL